MDPVGQVLFIGVGSAPALTYPLDGVTGVTAAWSMSRDLLTSFIGGSRYTAISSAVQSLTDQTGNARHMTDSATPAWRPAVATAGPSGRTCIDCVGGTYLNGPTLSSVITASTGYFMASFIIDNVLTNSGTSYQNDAVMADSDAYVGLLVRNTGTPATAQAFTWDGAEKVVTSVAINTATAHVMEWWHTGGNLFLCVNNGTPVSVAASNTISLAGTIRLGHGWNSSAAFLDGKIFEAYTASAVPSGRATITADFMAHIGAV